jgi:pimeloyl-ACP methyl ester carboxylesterase
MWQICQKSLTKVGIKQIDCAGHSYGGANCVYAASNNPGVHAIALNPISSGSIATKNAYLIDNYVVRSDIADGPNRFFERGLTGWGYEVKLPPNNPIASPSGIAGTTPSTLPSPILNPLTRHDSSRAIDVLGKQFGLHRYLNEFFVAQ